MSFYREIENIVEYLISIRKLEKYFSFDIVFPGSWSILKSQIDETKTVFTKNEEKGKQISFVSDLTEESISETIERIETIVKYNKEKEEKQRLFQEKVNELKNIFEKESLNDLKNLKFDKDEIPKFDGEESIS
jgi:hypothetical protein